MRSVIQRVSSASVTLVDDPTPTLSPSVAQRLPAPPFATIGRGLLVLVGVAPTDTEADAQWLAEKICALRIFPDADGKMNLSVRDVQLPISQPSALNSQPPPSASSAFESNSDLSALASPPSAPCLLIVSQFTLFASTRKGTRPSFNDAAKPDHAIPLYESFLRHATAALGRPVAAGRFGADMQIALVNDGPARSSSTLNSASSGVPGLGCLSLASSTRLPELLLVRRRFPFSLGVRVAQAWDSAPSFRPDHYQWRGPDRGVRSSSQLSEPCSPRWPKRTVIPRLNRAGFACLTSTPCLASNYFPRE